MTDDFLSRWSRRKIAARKGEAAVDAPTGNPGPTAVPAQAGIQLEAPAAAPLPPVESLTPESDFSAFMKPDVDPGLKRAALKVLLRDPRFNVMDGLDVYIDDYSKPDPMPAEWLDQLNQMKHLGHYIEPAEVPEGAEKPAAEASDSAPDGLQKAIEEQPVEPSPADTAVVPRSPSEVAQSGLPGKSIS